MIDKMSSPIVLSTKLVQRLNKQVKACKKPSLSGFLLGHSTNSGVSVVGSYACKDASTDALEKGWSDVSYYLPQGIVPVGFFYKTSQANMDAIVSSVLEKIIPRKVMQAWFGEKLLIWPVEPSDTDQAQVLYWYNMDGSSASRADFDLGDQTPFQDFISVRLHADLPIGCELSQDNGDWLDAIEMEFESLRKKLNDEKTVYHIRQTNVLLKDLPKPTATGVGLDVSLGEVLNMIEDEDHTDKQKRRKLGDFSQDVIHLDLLVNLSMGSPAGSSISCAPIIHQDHKDYQYLSLCLPVDVVLLMRSSDNVGSLLANLRENVHQQLVCMHRCLIHYRQGEDVHTPRPYHFLPHDTDHFLTVVYPDDVTDEQLELYRRELHDRFLLPDDRPCLRKLNAYRFPDEGSAGGYLTNTHIGLPTSGVKGGRVYQVSGTYSYHHYMQDRMDDNGWGCAYRSLQTLVSWFIHQGYTDKVVPTHKDMQQDLRQIKQLDLMLVDMGDKEGKFVGSKQWIGSTEVGYVLEHHLGVTSKILFVSSGAELGSKGRDLAMHFESQGTPVMIGGGVLAHTILGVDFNDVTGELKFLILDPHYTGAEDLKTIQDKGWCGWKGPDFWDQNAYYNMCMPQRPSVI